MVYRRTTRYASVTVDMGVCCRIASIRYYDQKKEAKIPKCIQPSQDVRPLARRIKRGTTTSLSSVMTDQFGQFQNYRMNGSCPHHSHTAPA